MKLIKKYWEKELKKKSIFDMIYLIIIKKKGLLVRIRIKTVMGMFYKCTLGISKIS